MTSLQAVDDMSSMLRCRRSSFTPLTLLVQLFNTDVITAHLYRLGFVCGRNLYHSAQSNCVFDVQRCRRMWDEAY